MNKNYWWLKWIKKPFSCLNVAINRFGAFMGFEISRYNNFLDSNKSVEKCWKNIIELSLNFRLELIILLTFNVFFSKVNFQFDFPLKLKIYCNKVMQSISLS